jgi:hypothetical protein
MYRHFRKRKMKEKKGNGKKATAFDRGMTDGKNT